MELEQLTLQPPVLPGCSRAAKAAFDVEIGILRLISFSDPTGFICHEHPFADLQ